MNAPMLLSRHTIFRSREAKAAEDSLCRNLCPHSLFVQQDQVDVIHNRVSLPSSELSFIRYGTSVEVRSPQLVDFYLLIANYTGSSRLRMNGRELVIGPGSGSLIAPDTAFTIEGSHEASVLVWKLKRQAVQEQADLLWGDAPASSLNGLRRIFSFSGDTSAGLTRALCFLAQELDAQDSVLLHPAGIAMMEKSLMMALFQMPPDLKPSLTHERIAPACVRQVEDYIRAHAGDDISMEDLIRQSGVSGRTLFRVFRHFRHMSPMAYLRTVRMNRIRADLLSPPHGVATVTDILARWGITQFGRFAADYKMKYGELPSQTMRKGGRGKFRLSSDNPPRNRRADDRLPSSTR